MLDKETVLAYQLLFLGSVTDKLCHDVQWPQPRDVYSADQIPPTLSASWCILLQCTVQASWGKICNALSGSDCISSN